MGITERNRIPTSTGGEGEELDGYSMHSVAQVLLSRGASATPARSGDARKSFFLADDTRTPSKRDDSRAVSHYVPWLRNCDIRGGRYFDSKGSSFHRGRIIFRDSLIVNKRKAMTRMTRVNYCNGGRTKFILRLEIPRWICRLLCWDTYVHTFR